jgi:hypothetical protein
MLGQDRCRVAFGNAEGLRQTLGCEIELMDVVVDEVEEVAHFLVSARLGDDAGAAQPVVEARELLGVAAIGLMRGDKRMGEAGRILRHQLQLLQAGRVSFENGIAQRLAERRQQPVALARGQIGDVDPESVGQPQQHRGRDGALVVLDLVEIAGGDP